MKRLLFLTLAGLAAMAAESSWTKVKDLKTGTELRIYKRGVKQPILAKSDEATDDKLIVVVKNEEVAIALADIDEVDYRPPRNGSRMVKETRTTGPTDPQPIAAAPTPRDHAGPVSSSSTSFGTAPKADFEVLYKRGAGGESK